MSETNFAQEMSPVNVYSYIGRKKKSWFMYSRNWKYYKSRSFPFKYYKRKRLL